MRPHRQRGELLCDFAGGDHSIGSVFISAARPAMGNFISLTTLRIVVFCDTSHASLGLRCGSRNDAESWPMTACALKISSASNFVQPPCSASRRVKIPFRKILEVLHETLVARIACFLPCDSS